MSALRPMPTPQRIDVDPDGPIRVTWRDGHVSEYTAKELRAACPCASCVDEWTGEVRVQAEQIPDDIVARTANRVGNYAVSFVWSDGHSTGIYAFDRLRALCRCSACRES